MAKDDGGSAFPGEDVRFAMPADGSASELQAIRRKVGGMSLRDWFAAALLPEAYAQELKACKEKCLSFSRTAVADECGRMADAMLAERSKDDGE